MSHEPEVRFLDDISGFEFNGSCVFLAHSFDKVELFYEKYGFLKIERRTLLEAVRELRTVCELIEEKKIEQSPSEVMLTILAYQRGELKCTR